MWDLCLSLTVGNIKTCGMIAYQSTYDSLADFIAALAPVKVLGFHAPAKIQDRVEELLEKR